jgi:aquaporin Z
LDQADPIEEMKKEGGETVKDTQKYVAEFLGTFTLVFIACGVAVVSGADLVATAFAFGLVVLAMVYAIGPISGCHINPAISIAMLVAGKMKGKDCLMYIIAQFLGAIVGAGLLLVVLNGTESYSLTSSSAPFHGLGQNGYGDGSPGFNLAACFLAEVVLTAIFLFAIFGSTSKAAPKGFAGISIGLTLTFVHLVGIPITGTSVNPARSFGPALFVRGDAISQVWLFLIAPVLGAILAALVWKLFFDSGSEEASPPA